VEVVRWGRALPLLVGQDLAEKFVSLVFGQNEKGLGGGGVAQPKLLLGVQVGLRREVARGGRPLPAPVLVGGPSPAGVPRAQAVRHVPGTGDGRIAPTLARGAVRIAVPKPAGRAVVQLVHQSPKNGQ